MIKSLLICLAVAIPGLTIKAQTAKWFITLSSGISIGGPGPSIKGNMEKNRFTADPQGWGNIIFGGHTDYPHVFNGLALLVTAGRKITTNGSVYLIFGQSNKGHVKGFNDIAVIDIQYDVLQFTGGYQFSFPKTGIKIGTGPSVFVFKYAKIHQESAGEKHTKIIPGLSVSSRMPFGKEKKVIGLEFFIELNLAPHARVEEFQTNMSTLKASDVNMVHGVIGLSLAFRK